MHIYQHIYKIDRKIVPDFQNIRYIEWIHLQEAEAKLKV